MLAARDDGAFPKAMAVDNDGDVQPFCGSALLCGEELLTKALINSTTKDRDRRCYLQGLVP